MPTLRSALPLLFAALLLAGCETTGSGPRAGSEAAKEAGKEAAKPEEPPLTRSQAASECWMKTEKGSAAMSIDKRADVVTKCIEDRLKAAAPAPAPAPKS